MTRETIRFELIGRMSRLQVINGTQVTPRYRMDGEIIYIKKCHEWMLSQNQTEEQLHQEHPRYRELVEMHGEPAQENKRLTSSILKDRLSDIYVHVDDKEIVKRLPSTTQVRNLRNMIQKLTRIPVRQQRLLVNNEGAQQEKAIEMDDDLRDLSFYGVEQFCHVYVERK
jgi:hypothetical protein